MSFKQATKFVQVAIGRLIVCGNPKCCRLFTSIPKPYSTGRFCSTRCARQYSRSKYVGHSEETRKKISENTKAAKKIAV